VEKKLVTIFGSLFLLSFGILAQESVTPPVAPASAIIQAQKPAKGKSLEGVKVESSEDLSEGAKKLLEQNQMSNVEQTESVPSPVSNPTNVNPSEVDQVGVSAPVAVPVEKVDMVIIKPPTIEEQAARIRKEIMEEKMRQSELKKHQQRSSVGVGQSGDQDQVGGDEAGGGSSGAAPEMMVIKAPTVQERAKLELMELERSKMMALQKKMGAGQGSGEGNGDGQGAGLVEAQSESVENAGQNAPTKTRKKNCKAKNLYECMASDGELKEKAAQIKGGGSQIGAPNGGEFVAGDANESSGQGTEEKGPAYVRPKVKFKSQAELRQQLIEEERQEQSIKRTMVGESGQDQVNAEATGGQSDFGENTAGSIAKNPSLQEKANQIKRELEQERSRKIAAEKTPEMNSSGSGESGSGLTMPVGKDLE